MGSTEIRSQGSAHNVGTLPDTDDGTVIGETELLVAVGGTGEPKEIYITSIYVRASAVGNVYFLQQETPVAPAVWAAFVPGDTTQVYSMYASATGDGITDVNIGPITSDLRCCSGGGGLFAADTVAGWINITYDYV